MHRVFISYHHERDQSYKEELIRQSAEPGIFEDLSVDTGDISEELEDETIRELIRDEYLRNSTVTVVLVGKETKKRKHVDWEIFSSMIDGTKNKRSGILVVLLPSANPTNTFHAAHENEKTYIYPDVTSWRHVVTRKEYEELYPFAPARIADNLVHPDAKMSVTTWARIDQRPEALRLLIDNAFESRMTNNYDLSRPMRRRNN